MLLDSLELPEQEVCLDGQGPLVQQDPLVLLDSQVQVDSLDYLAFQAQSDNQGDRVR